MGILIDKFGYNLTSTGHKLLNSKVRVIQGDGMSPSQIEQLLAKMSENSLAADNIAFGMGGGLLQKLDRDTQKFAFKCSYVEVNGVGRDVWKDPITDKGKISKRGILKLVKLDDGTYETVDLYSTKENQLKTVFYNGVLQRISTLDGIRERAQI